MEHKIFKSEPRIHFIFILPMLGCIILSFIFFPWFWAVVVFLFSAYFINSCFLSINSLFKARQLRIDNEAISYAQLLLRMFDIYRPRPLTAELTVSESRWSELENHFIESYVKINDFHEFGPFLDHTIRYIKNVTKEWPDAMEIIAFADNRATRLRKFVRELLKEEVDNK